MLFRSVGSDMKDFTGSSLADGMADDFLDFQRCLRKTVFIVITTGSQQAEADQQRPDKAYIFLHTFLLF